MGDTYHRGIVIICINYNRRDHIRNVSRFNDEQVNIPINKNPCLVKAGVLKRIVSLFSLFSLNFERKILVGCFGNFLGFAVLVTFFNNFLVCLNVLNGIF